MMNSTENEDKFDFSNFANKTSQVEEVVVKILGRLFTGYWTQFKIGLRSKQKNLK